MSRIGKALIKLNNVKIDEEKDFYKVTGSKGFVTVPKFKGFKLQIENNEVTVINNSKDSNANATWGLLRSLLNNATIGVDKGVEKRLEMVGVGYRASVAGKTLTLNVGFSHPVSFPLPEGVEATVEDNTKIVLRGINKILLGQTASNIKKIRKPESYKGKGIKYENEVIRRKAGKAGKGAA